MYSELIALLREIWPSLERFILGFVMWYETKSKDRQEMILKSSEARLKAFEVKKEVENDTKRLSDADLSRLTVDDDN